MPTVMGMNDVFWHWPNDYMWTGAGPRNFIQQINFPPGSFTAAPKVVASLCGLDSSQAHNLRVKLSVQNITATGFKVKVDTWADTKLAHVAVAWVAHRP